MIALKGAATGNHPTEATAAVTALAKIAEVVPSKIRRRIDSLQRVAILPGPHGSPSPVDTAVLTTIALAARNRRTFTPRTLPAADPAEYVRAQVRTAGLVHDVTAIVQLPATCAQASLGEWGTAIPLTETSCSVHIPASDLDWATFALAALHAPFTTQGPQEAIVHAAEWDSRLTAVAST